MNIKVSEKSKKWGVFKKDPMCKAEMVGGENSFIIYIRKDLIPCVKGTCFLHEPFHVLITYLQENNILVNNLTKKQEEKIVLMMEKATRKALRNYPTGAFGLLSCSLSKCKSNLCDRYSKKNFCSYEQIKRKNRRI